MLRHCDYKMPEGIFYEVTYLLTIQYTMIPKGEARVKRESKLAVGVLITGAWSERNAKS